MLIGIISDSHDNISKLKEAVIKLNDVNADLIIHLGDIVSPFCFDEIDKLNAEFMGVFGNNDGELIGLCEKSNHNLYKPPYEISLDNKSFILMHEPFGLDRLSTIYDYCLYGHTHNIDVRKTKRGYIINPGELCGYLTGRSTMAIVDTSRNSVQIMDV